MSQLAASSCSLWSKILKQRITRHICALENLVGHFGLQQIASLIPNNLTRCNVISTCYYSPLPWDDYKLYYIIGLRVWTACEFLLWVIHILRILNDMHLTRNVQGFSGFLYTPNSNRSFQVCTVTLGYGFYIKALLCLFLSNRAGSAAPPADGMPRHFCGKWPLKSLSSF